MNTKVVFLFDVDNTLLDNDSVIVDLRRFLVDQFGEHCTAEYFEIFEDLRKGLGYADYLGALQRYRMRHLREPDVLNVSAFLLEYPFAERLFPRALEVVERLGKMGPTVILSDGDVVFQPRKIARSGIREAVDGRVLIYIHKEQVLDDVERHYPAEHYVLVDDKVRILASVKHQWGSRCTTVFPRQGHYATAPDVASYPAPDFTVERIADVRDIDPSALVPR